MSSVRGCQLICPNNTHDPIPLPNDEPVAVGRSKQTRIIDQRCSRQQLEITAHWKTETVTVKQLGLNSSCLDGIELQQNRPCTLPHGATIYVLEGQYPHKVQFVKEETNHMKNDKMSSDVRKRSTSLDNGHGKDAKKKKVDKLSETKLAEDENISSKGKIKKTVKCEKETAATERKQKENNKESSNSKKRTSSSLDIEKDRSAKKMKLSSDVTDEEDEELSHIKEKIKTLKQWVKHDNKAAKPSTSSESVDKGNRSSDDRGSSGSREGSPAKESSWEHYDKLYVYTKRGVQARSRIAGFDIDGTIITTMSGNVFPKTPADWKILYPDIPGKLKKLQDDGYKIVLMTNQKGVATGKTKIEDLKRKFTDVLDKMGVKAQILISTGEGFYRKPALGMWKYLSEKGNQGISINKKESFYVGDAAGRPAKWAPGKKKDFSCSDRLFALNAGLKFYTPEEYFLNKKPVEFNMPEFDPRKVDSSTRLTSPANAKIDSPEQEVVVLVGSPACGKSYFAKKHLIPKGYEHVNRDTLGTWQKCVSRCSSVLKGGQSVVIDNTNPDLETRARYIACAKAAKVPCRCFLFQPSFTQIKHNERFRELTDKTHKPISDMVLNSFKSKYKDPSLSEGFKEIVKINFVPEFDNPKHERLYKQFLVEK